MKQSRIDSFMEAVANILVGIPISMVTWQITAWLFGIPMPVSRNLAIIGIFTVVSLVRQWVLRRMFNGRSVWMTIRDKIT